MGLTYFGIERIKKRLLVYKSYSNTQDLVKEYMLVIKDSVSISILKKNSNFYDKCFENYLKKIFFNQLYLIYNQSLLKKTRKFKSIVYKIDVGNFSDINFLVKKNLINKDIIKISFFKKNIFVNLKIFFHFFLVLKKIIFKKSQKTIYKKKSILVNEYFGEDLYNKNDFILIHNLINKFNIYYNDKHNNLYEVKKISLKNNKILFKKIKYPSFYNLDYDIKSLYFNILKKSLFNFAYIDRFLTLQILEYLYSFNFWKNFIKNLNVKFIINDAADNKFKAVIYKASRDNHCKLINIQRSHFLNQKLFYLHYICDFYLVFSKFNKKLGKINNIESYNVDKFILRKNYFNNNKYIDKKYYYQLKNFKEKKPTLILFNSTLARKNSYSLQAVPINIQNKVMKIICDYAFKNNFKVIFKLKKNDFNTRSFIEDSFNKNLYLIDDYGPSRNLYVYKNIVDLAVAISCEYSMSLSDMNSFNIPAFNYDYGGINQITNEYESFVNFLSFKNKVFKFIKSHKLKSNYSSINTISKKNNVINILNLK